MKQSKPNVKQALETLNILMLDKGMSKPQIRELLIQIADALLIAPSPVEIYFDNGQRIVNLGAGWVSQISNVFNVSTRRVSESTGKDGLTITIEASMGDRKIERSSTSEDASIAELQATRKAVFDITGLGAMYRIYWDWRNPNAKDLMLEELDEHRQIAADWGRADEHQQAIAELKVDDTSPLSLIAKALEVSEAFIWPDGLQRLKRALQKSFNEKPLEVPN